MMSPHVSIACVTAVVAQKELVQRGGVSALSLNARQQRDLAVLNVVDVGDG